MKVYLRNKANKFIQIASGTIIIYVFCQGFANSQVVQIGSSDDTVFLERQGPEGSAAFEIGENVSIVADINNSTSNAIQSDISQDWHITNRGILHGTGNGVGRGSGMWIESKTPGAVVIDNYGVIIGDGKETLGENAGISLRKGGAISNHASGSISSAGDGVHMKTFTSLYNDGLIEATGPEKDFSAVYFFAGGKLENKGIIKAAGNLGYGVAVGTSTQLRPTKSIIDNSGTVIGGTGFLAIGEEITLNNAGVVGTNHAGGNSVKFLGANNTLHLTTGSQLNGTAISSNVSNRILLSGSGSEDDDFTGFDTLEMDGNNWHLSGNVSLGGKDKAAVLVKNGALILSGNVTFGADDKGMNGGATVASGASMMIGNGGGTGSLFGNIRNDGSLSFSRSNQLVYDYVIDGSGTVQNEGNGVTVFTKNNTYTGLTTIKSGGIQLGNGGNEGGIKGNVSNKGRMIIDRANTFEFDGRISGSGSLEQIGVGRTILLGDSGGFSGKTSVHAGVLAVNGTLGGTMHVLAGRLQGSGTVGSTTLETGAIIAPGNDDMGTLTVSGDYHGNGGTIAFNTVLGADNSPTSKLKITGSSTGTSAISITNRKGLGAPTREGIKIINVAGQSDANFSLLGDFRTLDGRQAVVAGAYAYTLHKNGVQNPSDGDWYLRSSLKDTPNPSHPLNPIPHYNPAVPVYEGAMHNMQALSRLPTLRERVGSRYWGITENALIAEDDEPANNNETQNSEQHRYTDKNGVWGRVAASHSRLKPDTSKTAMEQDINTYRIQSGVDAMLAEGEAGTLLGSIHGQYAKANSDVFSAHGRGTIETKGWGLGSALTWYDNNGLYIDGQAQALWFDNGLNSTTLRTSLASHEKNYGYGLSLEVGRHLYISENWSLTPQVQLMWSSVSSIRFRDKWGADISLNKAVDLIGRLGVSANYEMSWYDSSGSLARKKLFTSVDMYQSLRRSNSITVAADDFSTEQARTWIGLGAGGTYNWAGDKYSIYGEGSINTSLSPIFDNYNVKGTLGIRVKW